MKGLDLLSRSARLAGFLADGETLQGNAPQDMLLSLQSMMDFWQADGLKIFQENILTLPLTIGQQTYLLGPGATGAFQVTRPAKIQRAGMLLTSSNPIQPPEIPISVLDYEGWANIRVKNIQGNYPLNVYPDYGFPNMTLFVYQIPGLACSLTLYAWNPLPTFPDLSTTDVTFPPAYQEAITYNMAVKIMAEYKLPPDPLILGIAQNALTSLKDINLPSPIMTCDPGLTGRAGYYDWRSDTFVDRR